MTTKPNLPKTQLATLTALMLIELSNGEIPAPKSGWSYTGVSGYKGYNKSAAEALQAKGYVETYQIEGDPYRYYRLTDKHLSW